MTDTSPRPAYDVNDSTTMVLDLESPHPKEFLAIVEAFEADIKAHPDLGPLEVETGWNEINPELAAKLLRRNRPGANRKIDYGTVAFYGSQMKRGDWKATGQPVIFDDQEHLVDAQHRLYGCLLSGVSFKTYVLTGVEHFPGIFAYLDSVRPRTAATALQTAGFNGVSSTIAKVIRIAEEVSCGVYNPTGPTKLLRMSPADILKLATKYPNARSASRSAASDWDEVVTYVAAKRKETIAYLGMRMIDLYGEEMADDFFAELMDPDGLATDHPISALRKEIDKNNRAEKPMKRQYVIAAVILAFNAWRRHESLGRRWMVAVNEEFPMFDEPPPQAEAAE